MSVNLASMPEMANNIAKVLEITRIRIVLLKHLFGNHIHDIVKTSMLENKHQVITNSDKENITPIHK